MSIDLRPQTPPAPLTLGAIAAACDLTTDSPQIAVTGVTHDSRAVREGDLFAALPGEHAHGATYAEQARARGAVAVLTDAAGVEIIRASGLPVLVAADPRESLGAVAAEVYGHPARDLLLIGVTGTNGKSTTVHLLEAGLQAAGHRTGIIGTTGVRIADRDVPNDRTTPEAPDLHALLARMREEGVTAVAMEVSSHALVLGRVNGLVCDYAIFTQLTQDHLDFHGTMEDYYAAKADLFTAARARQAVIGVDGMWGRRLADHCEIPHISYALDHDADVVCASVLTHPTGQTLTVRDDALPGDAGATFDIEVGLPGRFNAANALGAWAALRASGVLPAVLSTAFAEVRVPGRMEIIDEGQDFSAIVDYAHSPDAVERVICAVIPRADSRRIVVLGCGGDRDRDKRFAMGDVAAAGADVLIVTDDNPRSEDPAAIRAAMLAGAHSVGGDIREIGDRREAIAAAVALAGSGDVLLVLGKGHEPGQESAGVITPFDDRAELRAALRTKLGGSADPAAIRRGSPA
ncbi:MAG: UDP-N-acetylmuramoyl-L-alanyl-D-glutamate--2,6-diaminopimelate ligase [Candidatus Nanopelagicales bacterium]